MYAQIRCTDLRILTTDAVKNYEHGKANIYETETGKVLDRNLRQNIYVKKRKPMVHRPYKKNRKVKSRRDSKTKYTQKLSSVRLPKT